MVDVLFSDMARFLFNTDRTSRVTIPSCIVTPPPLVITEVTPKLVIPPMKGEVWSASAPTFDADSRCITWKYERGYDRHERERQETIARVEQEMTEEYTWSDAEERALSAGELWSGYWRGLPPWVRPRHEPSTYHVPATLVSGLELLAASLTTLRSRFKKSHA